MLIIHYASNHSASSFIFNFGIISNHFNSILSFPFFLVNYAFFLSFINILLPLFLCLFNCFFISLSSVFFQSFYFFSFLPFALLSVSSLYSSSSFFISFILSIVSLFFPYIPFTFHKFSLPSFVSFTPILISFLSFLSPPPSFFNSLSYISSLFFLLQIPSFLLLVPQFPPLLSSILFPNFALRFVHSSFIHGSTQISLLICFPSCFIFMVYFDLQQTSTERSVFH